MAKTGVGELSRKLGARAAIAGRGKHFYQSAQNRRTDCSKLRVTAAVPGKVNFELDILKQHTNRLNILHGGTIASMGMTFPMDVSFAGKQLTCFPGS